MLSDWHVTIGHILLNPALLNPALLNPALLTPILIFVSIATSGKYGLNTSISSVNVICLEFLVSHVPSLACSPVR